MNENPIEKARQITNVGYFVLSIWAMTIVLPFRRFPGKDFIGIRGLAGVLFIPLYAAFAEAPLIMYLLPVHVMCAVLHGSMAWARHLRGIVQHSRYEGVPWAGRLVMPFCKDERICRAVGEPLLAFFAGILLLPYGDSLGMYFIIGAWAMAMVQQASLRQYRRRIDEINNGRIENDNLMRDVLQPHTQRRR